MITRLENAESDLCDDIRTLADVVAEDTRFEDIVQCLVDAYDVEGGFRATPALRAVHLVNIIIKEYAQAMVDAEDLAQHEDKTEHINADNRERLSGFRD